MGRVMEEGARAAMSCFDQADRCTLAYRLALGHKLLSRSWTLVVG